MSSRIEVELTSQKADGIWTWRAAGAKEPRGTLEGSLLYEGAKVGDVVRAEVVFEIDGITVESIMAPKPKKVDSNLLELASREPVSFLTRTVSGRDRGNRNGDRRPPKGKARNPRSLEEVGSDGATRRKPRDDQRHQRTTSGSTDPSQNKAERKPGQEPQERKSQRRQIPKAAPVRFKKLTPKNTHRAKALESIAPEHLPIAEQLLKGGIPAVRQALAVQNEKAIAEGKPTVPESALLAIAEPMLPALKLATWKDRAEEATRIAPEASLRDLRSVLSAAELIKHDEETRAMLENLKELTKARAESLSTEWISEIKENLSGKRVIRAVRLSSRPPEPTTKLPPELAEELTEAVDNMMSPETPSDRWMALIEALALSPIRRQVHPKGLPENASSQLIELAKENSGRIPSLAQMLGIAIPPPPRPRKKIVADAPVADAPVADAPVADAPVADAPVVDAPVVDAPVVDAPDEQ